VSVSSHPYLMGTLVFLALYSQCTSFSNAMSQGWSITQNDSVILLSWDLVLSTSTKSRFTERSTWVRLQSCPPTARHHRDTGDCWPRSGSSIPATKHHLRFQRPWETEHVANMDLPLATNAHVSAYHRAILCQEEGG